MARMCFMFEIFEGQEAEYKKRHDEIWPELVTAIKDAGFKNYSLFRRGVHVIGYFEVEPDVKTAFEKLGKSEATYLYLSGLGTATGSRQEFLL